MGLIWSNQTCGKKNIQNITKELVLSGDVKEEAPFFPPVFLFILTHHHFLMVLKLQAKVVTFNEVHVGADQVKQHLAGGFLL